MKGIIRWVLWGQHFKQQQRISVEKIRSFVKISLKKGMKCSHFILQKCPFLIRKNQHCLQWEERLWGRMKHKEEEILWGRGDQRDRQTNWWIDRPSLEFWRVRKSQRTEFPTRVDRKDGGADSQKHVSCPLRRWRRWTDYLKTGLVFCHMKEEKRYLLLPAYTVLSLTVTDQS